MQVSINFSVDNAVFQDGDEGLDFGAIADAIRGVATQIESQGAVDRVFRVRDTASGTRVGFAVINEDGVVH